MAQPEARTMASDIKSVQESGGGAPRPYVPPQAPSTSPFAAITPPPAPKPPAQQNMVMGQTPPPAPSSAPKTMAVDGSAKKPSGGSKKGVFALVLSFVIVVGAGAIGYFFVFPLFSSTPSPAPTDTTPPTTNTQPEPSSLPEDTGAGLFEIPEGTIGTETPKAAAPSEETSLPVPSAPAPTHTSFLSLPADMTSQVPLNDIAASSIRQALGFKTAQVSSLQEAALTRDGSPLRLADLGAGLLPQLFTADLLNVFAEDFTYAVYTDSKGSWPVYILGLKSGADVASAKSKFAAIEGMSAGNLGNLYLSNPGAGSSWKDGQVLGTSGRYFAFTQSGASLNYVWVNNRLVLGTSYAATQEAAKRLGS